MRSYICYTEKGVKKYIYPCNAMSMNKPMKGCVGMYDLTTGYKLPNCRSPCKFAKKLPLKLGEMKMSEEWKADKSQIRTIEESLKKQKGELNIPNSLVSFSINIFNPNTEIWIADDVCINCRAKFRWWNKFFLKLVFGWRVKEIKKK